MALSGFYPGSFDPVTNGHLDIIERSFHLVDRLIVGVGVHHGKSAFLPADRRISLIEEVAGDKARQTGTELDVVAFDNLVVDAARGHNADILIRGLRDGRDFDYERQMAHMNAELAADLETVFLAASPGTSFIASSLVKQIAVMGGDIKPFVPARVAQAIAATTANK